MYGVVSAARASKSKRKKNWNGDVGVEGVTTFVCNSPGDVNKYWHTLKFGWFGFSVEISG